MQRKQQTSGWLTAVIQRPLSDTDAEPSPKSDVPFPSPLLPVSGVPPLLTDAASPLLTGAVLTGAATLPLDDEPSPLPSRAGAVPVADGGARHREDGHSGEASARAQPVQGVGRHRQPHVTLQHVFMVSLKSERPHSSLSVLTQSIDKEATRNWGQPGDLNLKTITVSSATPVAGYWRDSSRVNVRVMLRVRAGR